MTETSAKAHPTEEVEVPKYLSIDDLAARWDMNRNSLANWRTQGKGPRFIKIGKSVLYPLQEVEAYEAKQPLKRSTSE